MFDELDSDKLTSLLQELEETFFDRPEWPFSGTGQEVIDELVHTPLKFVDGAGRWQPP